MVRKVFVRGFIAAAALAVLAGSAPQAQASELEFRTGRVVAMFPEGNDGTIRGAGQIESPDGLCVGFPEDAAGRPYYVFHTPDDVVLADGLIPVGTCVTFQVTGGLKATVVAVDIG